MGVKTDAAGVRRLVGAYGRADGRSVASVSSIDWSDMSTVCVCVCVCAWKRQSPTWFQSRGTAIGRRSTQDSREVESCTLPSHEEPTAR